MSPWKWFPYLRHLELYFTVKLKTCLSLGVHKCNVAHSTNPKQSTNSIIIYLFIQPTTLHSHSSNVFLFTAVLIELKLTSKKDSSLDENTNEKNKNQNYTSSEQQINK